MNSGTGINPYNSAFRAAKKGASSSLIINTEYAESVPSLSKEEYEALKDDISKRGLSYPIIINKEGCILDGHHRYKICNELGIEPITSIKEFPNELSESEFVIMVNLCRRQLNDFQKAELATSLEKLESERARKRQLSGLKIGLDERQGSFTPIEGNGDFKQIGETADIISKKVGISRGTYERAKTIIKSSDELLKHKVRSGNWSINRGFTEIRNQEKKNEVRRQMQERSFQFNGSNLAVKDRIKLIHGDCKETCDKEIKNDSIDLILTDPPYDDNSVYLYGKIAELAVRVLKLGGNLVMYASNYYLPQIFEQIKRYPELNWIWQFCVNHNGNRATIFQRHIFVEWKPMLWFAKGELQVTNSVYDFIQSETPDKTTHEWAQSTVEAEYIIKNLAPFEDQIILDPLMGDGTTGIAALKLHHKFIGIEIDKERFENAKYRIYNKNNMSRS